MAAGPELLPVNLVRSKRFAGNDMVLKCASWVLTSFVALTLISHEVSADDVANSKQTDGGTAQKEPKDPFAVPDGTPRELFRFINSVKHIPPVDRSQESMTTHLKRQVGAVEQAADRILEQDVSDADAVRAIEEKYAGLSYLSRVDPTAQLRLKSLAQSYLEDVRPMVVKSAEFQLLQLNIVTGLRNPVAARSIPTLIEKFVTTHGVDSNILAIGVEVGRMLGDRNPQIAASLLTYLANEARQSGDPALAANADQLAGTARRLNLPGNFMELSGTTAEGNAFDWDSYRGKFVLVDFWASWCGPCRAEIPNVKTNLAKYEAKGFAVVGINIDRSRNDYESYVAEARIPWENIMPDADGSSQMANMYGVTGIPTVILVDREGKVVSVSARGTELGRLLELHLGDGDPDDSDKPS